MPLASKEGAGGPTHDVCHDDHHDNSDTSLTLSHSLSVSGSQRDSDSVSRCETVSLSLRHRHRLQRQTDTLSLRQVVTHSVTDVMKHSDTLKCPLSRIKNNFSESHVNESLNLI